MKIQDQDTFHGAALMQIVEHQSFKALNKADDKYGHYLVNKDARLWIKYASREEGPWSFTLQPSDATTISVDFNLPGSTHMVLVCGRASICCLDKDEIEGLVALNGAASQWIRVESPHGKQMRVTGSKNGKAPLLIAHNKFPYCIFE